MKSIKYLAVTCTAAVLACSVISTTGIGAASAVDASVTHLIQSLTASGTMTKADDYNGDGSVNAIDLTLLKRDLMAAENADTGELKTQTVTPTNSNVKKIGRTLTKDGITWLVQSGSAIECTVTGTEASVTITGDGCVYSDEKYRPRYGIYVDGELVADVVMSEPEQVVELFSGSTQRTVTVKVMHLSEANNGAVGVKQFDLTSSVSTPVKATAKKDLTIEFIGDSITCAYGVEADSQYVNFSTATENFSLSYAYLTAQLLNADYSAVCYSGYGVVSGYSNDGTINTNSLVPPVYEYTGSLSDYKTSWDFAANPVDAIVINLGTNDDSYAGKDLENRGLEYQEKYVEFLGTIRKNNPDAVIVCTLGIMGCEELYPYLEAAVAEFGDAKVSCYQSPTHDFTNNGIGADWHPSAKTHELNSYLLASHLSEALGMEYSGIGLDFAANGTYSLSYDSDAGANAWPYFSEWDRSFNVNISSGGKEDDDMVVYLRDLSLTPGEYTLAFSVNPPSKSEIRYEVRSTENTSSPHCTDVITGSGEYQTISKTFRIDKTDDSVEIAFYLGTISTGNITFKNLSLYKWAE